MSKDVLAAAAALAAFIFGVSCSSTMDTQLIRYPEGEHLASRGPNCEGVEIFHTATPTPEGCQEVGDAFVGDIGYSSSCGTERVLDEVRAMACMLGADLARYTELFDGISSCTQVRAKLYRCSTEEEGVVE